MVYNHQNYYSNFHYDYKPSAPPFDEYDVQPSAPPFEDPVTPSHSPIPLYEDSEEYKKTINEQKTFQSRPLDLKEECAICLENLENKPDGDMRQITVLNETKCSHFFHDFCLQKHLNEGMNQDCPMCRTALGNPGSVKEIRLNAPAKISENAVGNSNIKQEDNKEQPEINTVNLASSIFNGLRMLGRATEYVGTTVLNLLSEKPTVENIMSKWNLRRTALERMADKQREELVLLLALISSVPNNAYTQRDLNKIDRYIKHFYDKMENENERLLKLMAAIHQQFASSIN